MPADSGDTVIYRCAGADAVKDLEAGRKVLIISRGTKEALPKSRAVTFRPDFWSPMFHSADGDGYVLGCSIDAEHPYSAISPQECSQTGSGFDMIEGSRSILLNDGPAGLKPIVQAIPTIDLGERLGTLSEARAGGGRLMVCSLDLIGCSSRAAAQLLYSIKKYMDSDEFDPETEGDLPLIRELLPETVRRKQREKMRRAPRRKRIRQRRRTKAQCTGPELRQIRQSFFEALEQARMLRREDYTADAWNASMLFISRRRALEH